MAVYQIEAEMPATELVEWFAHFKLSKIEADFEREKAENRAKACSVPSANICSNRPPATWMRWRR